MKWTVEVTGESRELYEVEAETEEEAMTYWFNGNLVLQETSSAEPVSARSDEESDA